MWRQWCFTVCRSRLVSATHTAPAGCWAQPTCNAGIFEFELLAAALAVCLAASRFPGRPLLVCCDNQGAIGAVIHGSCETALGRLLSSFLWRIAAESNIPIWIAYVYTGFNVADAPSRWCTSPSPWNDFTKNIPNAQLPSRFAQALRSIRDLEQMGAGTMTVDEAQWKPHVHDAEEI